MDPLQQKSLDALEQYILLSKSASSPRAAADLVVKATSDPNTYVFAELLETPNIQSLRTASAEYAPYLTLLEIFSWGTWSDYTSKPNLPELSEPQKLKLRQLSVLSLSTSHVSLTYDYLLQALDLPSIRALEDLVISSIYAGLISAKLDTLVKRVDVSSVAPLRDLKPNSIPQLIAILEDWNCRCATVLTEIEGQVSDIRTKAATRRKREKEHEAKLEKALKESGGREITSGKRGAGETESGGGPNFFELGDAMDVDDRGEQRNAKRGGRFGGGAGIGRRLGP